MNIPENISNSDLFKLIESNINWTNQWQQIFYITTYVQFRRRGFLSPKQRSVLFKIAAEVGELGGHGDGFTSDQIVKPFKLKSGAHNEDKK